MAMKCSLYYGGYGMAAKSRSMNSKSQSMIDEIRRVMEDPLALNTRAGLLAV